MIGNHIELFLNIDFLSFYEQPTCYPHTYEAPDIGMLIILNLYQVAHKVSMPTFMVTNSAPNTDVSMVHCFLE